MNERIINYGVVALAVVGLGLAAYELYAHYTEAEGEAVGRQAPRVSLPVVDSDKRVSLEEFRGKVVLLDFWATWCPPCREQMPAVQNLEDDESLSDSVQILSINTDEQGDDPEKKADDYLEEHDFTFTTLLDDGSAADAFGVTQLPTLVVVDPDGRITHREMGVHSEDELRKLIDRARQR
ncbi:MAG: TlpA family protein disulfide reductase [Persicimonas sp.]